jgi:chemotaxis protein MotB
MRRDRRKHDEEHEPHDRWLVSYADFMTLLFAFFVVMYAMSSINEGKYRVFSDSVGDALGLSRSAPGVAIDAPALLALPNPARKRRNEALRHEKEHMTRLAQNLLSTLAPLVKEGKVRVTQNSRGVSVEINASILFNQGDALLTEQSDQALRAVAVLLKDDPHAVQVEGHTDTMPISNAQFPSNWELSAARASAVVRLFIGAGVASPRLSAVGHGDNLAVAPNDTEAGRARNRRVAITIVSGLPDVVTDIATDIAPEASSAAASGAAASDVAASGVSEPGAAASGAAASGAAARQSAVAPVSR